MTYLDTCPQCGGQTWDNSQDDRPGGDWKCRDRDCKDPNGYQMNEWGWNAVLQARGEGGEQTAPAKLRKDFSNAALAPVDALPFSRDDRVKLWVQAYNTVQDAMLQAQDDLILADAQAFQKLVVTEMIWLDRNKRGG